VSRGSDQRKTERHQHGEPVDDVTKPHAPLGPRALELRNCDYLVVVGPPGPLLNRPYALDRQTCVAGRNVDCDVVLTADEVSRRHARLDRTPGGWLVTDLRSSNGTFARGERIDSPTVIAPGEQLQIGSYVLRLVSAGSPELRQYHELFRESRLDALTGLPQRELFEEVAASLLRQTHESAAVLLTEIEYLDHFNARHGRERGDKVLRRCVEQMLSEATGNVHAGRHLGKRFAFLVLGVGLPEARTLSEQLRTAVARAQTGLGEDSVRLDLSVGGIVKGAATERSFGRLLSEAEPLMQQMSRLGGGVLVEDMAGLEAEESSDFGDHNRHETGVWSLEDVVEPVAMLARAAFERCLESCSKIVALSLDQRHAIEVKDPALLLKLERLLESALASVRRRASGAGVTLGSKPGFHIGRLPGGYYAMGVSGTLAGQASKFAADVQREFERARASSGAIVARVVVSDAIDVRRGEDAIGRALQVLQRQLAATREDRLPSPIAWAMSQASAFDEPIQRFFAVARLQQAVARWLFSVFAAECLAAGLTSRGRPGRPPLHKPSDGAWLQLTRMFGEMALEVPPGQRRAPSLLAAVFPRGKRSDVLTELEAFTEVRNGVAHRTVRSCEAHNAEWMPRLEALIRGPLGVLESVVARQIVQLRLRGTVFEVSCRDLVGDHLVMPLRTTETSEPLEDRKVFLFDAASAHALPLDPLVVHANCPLCHLDELFFLDGMDERPTFGSLREGRHVLPSLLAAGKDERDTSDAEAALTRLLG